MSWGVALIDRRLSKSTRAQPKKLMRTLFYRVFPLCYGQFSPLLRHLTTLPERYVCQIDSRSGGAPLARLAIALDMYLVVQIDRRGLAARSDSTWVLSFSVISHASPRGNIVRRFGDARKEVNMPRQEASIRPLNEGAVHCNVLLCVCVGRDQS